MRFLAVVGTCVAAINFVVQSSTGRFPTYRARMEAGPRGLSDLSKVHSGSTPKPTRGEARRKVDQSPARTVATCRFRAPRNTPLGTPPPRPWQERHLCVEANRDIFCRVQLLLEVAGHGLRERLSADDDGHVRRVARQMHCRLTGGVPASNNEDLAATCVLASETDARRRPLPQRVAQRRDAESAIGDSSSQHDGPTNCLIAFVEDNHPAVFLPPQLSRLPHDREASPKHPGLLIGALGELPPLMPLEKPR